MWPAFVSSHVHTINGYFTAHTLACIISLLYGSAQPINVNPARIDFSEKPQDNRPAHSWLQALATTEYSAYIFSSISFQLSTTAYQVQQYVNTSRGTYRGGKSRLL